MNTFKTAAKKVEETRERRKNHNSSRVRGTPRQPRVSVFRSHKHFSVQIIDDINGKTLAAASSNEKDLRGQVKHGGNIAASAVVAKKLAERAKAANITFVVFDKGWYRYHGRVKAFAEALRKEGLKF